MLAAPAYLGEDSFLSMNSFEPLFWMGCAYCLLLAVNRRDDRYLVAFGAVAGLGLMNKHSMVFFGAALVAGLVVTPERRLVASRWFWVGGLVAALVFAPNVVWEYRHDWATLEDLRNVQATGKNVELSPLAFVAQQFLLMSPLAAPVWLAGLWHLLVDRDGRRYRFLGVAYLGRRADGAVRAAGPSGREFPRLPGDDGAQDSQDRGRPHRPPPAALRRPLRLAGDG
jgi:4-amino-4-deoxy-L-arabinose transferase-like glycosyltransferase